jgi:hypothetical protein
MHRGGQSLAQPISRILLSTTPFIYKKQHDQNEGQTNLDRDVLRADRFGLWRR